MKNLFATKKFYLHVSGTILGLIGTILYFVTMKLQNNSYIGITLTLIATMIIAIVSLILNKIKVLDIASASLLFLAGLLFFVTQLDNIGYAITNTKIGDGIMPTFVISVVCLFVASIINSIAVYIEK